MSEQRYTVAVDFDGVLHRYDTPWVDAVTIPDEPVEGAVEWLRSIAEKFVVVIHTTRGKTAEGQAAVHEWLDHHGFYNDHIHAFVVTAVKLPALVYIDDRAWRFEGDNFPTVNEIHRALPWHKREAEKPTEQPDHGIEP